MNIDEMPAGREMDALVAEKVFSLKEHTWSGLSVIDGINTDRIGTCKYCGKEFDMPIAGYGICRESASHYSTDIASAWEVVEKFKQDGAMFSLDFGNGKNGFSCYIRMNEKDKSGHSNEAFVRADSAPLAICRAALKAMEVH